MNFLGILLGVVLNFLLFKIWYGFLFNDSWRLLTGRIQEEKLDKKQKLVAIILATLMSFGASVVVAVIGIVTYTQAIYTAMTLGLFFVLPITIGGWIGDKKPFALVLINTAFYIIYIALIIAGFVFTLSL